MCQTCGTAEPIHGTYACQLHQYNTTTKRPHAREGGRKPVELRVIKACDDSQKPQPHNTQEAHRRTRLGWRRASCRDTGDMRISVGDMGASRRRTRPRSGWALQGARMGERPTSRPTRAGRLWGTAWIPCGALLPVGFGEGVHAAWL